MPMFLCLTYEQSDEKCGSMSLRNACKKCGRTLEAHQIDEKTADQEARDWLVKNNLEDKPYFELVKNILTQYIKETKR